ncbi:NAD(P)/FAD-dependent oxidoreductase [Apilactobacillus xinyiensis]|uniref:Ferredoxin--NADP reductase n=1 Tax=Apilactobacillus xinyiensis TaxID=2841032 RepID=A0ABT0I2K9_9LACO|nr:NAD(P)/FAD-dependent oxidoreductase [Apilactobacillus xinyiensis]MCK8624944.1 NAD(P)/FAD-dependent oxidoreductase [Apilactobacillus xinyiensis]MCL0318987.1 NAD(P)/FAD-dependent oxidoreductase [Apilactobacillus xinyiensis]
MNKNIYDITIIGGGPVGMFAGFYSGLRNAKVQIIESLDELGGQVNALYPEKTILDVAGFAGLTGRELVNNLKAQLLTMQPDISLNTTVKNVKKVDDFFAIETDKGTTQSRAIIIATGNGSFKPRKLLADNADKYENNQIQYFIKNLDDFKDKQVLVAGGGDSAIDQALMLEKVAKKVYLLHRRNEFRGLERMVSRLKTSSVELVTPYLIKEVQPADGNQITLVAKKMRTDDEFKTITVDKMLVNYGFVADSKAMKNWDINLQTSHRLLKVDSKMQTNIPNVYAVGDQANYDGKQTIIATGFGEVPLAVNGIMQNLYPNSNAPIHSTQLSK